ncbi:uncharacterized protein LOC123546304 [Mercenaria mercenaria]|uniref:uncharacterized protein LOC123546304 n=1 Tax=Mercenaria mercenaria TaxID=6596 RepID=UPI00234F2582|nr:uncharacterized protein LOC123546304 [Mercenaria mercenaria]
MENSRIAVAILGHSFIRRLDDSFRRQILPANYDLKECSVIHRGLGGLLACENYNGLRTCTNYFKHKFDSFLNTHKPRVVVLQLGENDIDSGIQPLEVASTLEEIGLMLLKDYNVGHVVICELFTRLKPKNTTDEQYESKRVQANQILKALLEGHKHIRYWNHRRIFRAQTQIFAKDGIHLGPFGQRRFYRSLRHAIMTAVRQAT